MLSPKRLSILGAFATSGVLGRLRPEKSKPKVKAWSDPAADEMRRIQRDRCRQL